MKKVLIIKLGALGDVVHTSIIAEAIKLKHPDWIVDFLTTTDCLPILENHPYIDESIVWEHSYNKTFKGFVEIAIKLFKKRYDYVFSPSKGTWASRISYIIMPKKVVFRKKLGGLWVKDYFEMAKSIIPDLEMPDHLTLGVSKEASESIEAELQNYAKPFFVIAPGRAVDNVRQGRLWNINKWKELTAMLLQEYGGTVFVVGNDKERENHETLTANNVVIKSGDYSLEETSALLSKASMMISGDTGPAHIAAAHGVKTLALLGSTAPEQIKPHGKNGYYISADYDCLYCWKKHCDRLKEGEIYTPCMEALSAKTVMDKIKEIYN